MKTIAVIPARAGSQRVGASALKQVFPPSASEDALYAANTDFVMNSQGCRPKPALSYKQDIMFGEFGSVVILTVGRNVKLICQCVDYVFALCAIFKILGEVIKRIAINVVDDVPWRSRTDESRGNKSMYVDPLISPILAEKNSEVASVAPWVSTTNSADVSRTSRPDAFNSAKVGYNVPTFVPRDIFPSLFHA